MELKELKREIPHKWRVQSFSRNKAMAQCVAYIDSRDVMNTLDKVCGMESWQSDYKEVKGNIYAGIGIKINGEWVWKWDCGAESHIEKEKGEASDSFKRAGVKWGIGRFLYELKMHYVKANKIQTDNSSRGIYPMDDTGNNLYSSVQLTDYINSLKN